MCPADKIHLRLQNTINSAAIISIEQRAIPFVLDDRCEDAKQYQTHKNDGNHDDNLNRVISVARTITFCNTAITTSVPRTFHVS